MTLKKLGISDRVAVVFTSHFSPFDVLDACSGQAYHFSHRDQ